MKSEKAAKKAARDEFFWEKPERRMKTGLKNRLQTGKRDRG